jgi:hypothetical protein
VQYGNLALDPASPVEKYLPYLNIVLCGLLVIAGMVMGGRRELLWSGFGNVPGLVYLLVLMAKMVMGSVDVGELEALKYGFKGA